MDRQDHRAAAGPAHLIPAAWWCLLACWLCCVSTVVHANTILAWQLLNGGRRGMVVQLSDPPAQAPTHFALTNPPRIVIDFAEAVLAAGRAREEHASAPLRAISAIQAGRRARIVLDLSRAVGYRAETLGNRFLVRFDDDAADVSRSAPVVEDIDFRRGDDGAGRVVLRMSAPGVRSEVARQGDRLVVRLTGISLPESLRRGFDVTDFGTPVRMMEATAVPFAGGAGQGTAILTIVSHGRWRYHSHQTDTRLVIDVAPQGTSSADTMEADQRISLDFRSIDIRALLQVFAHFTGLNLLTSDTVAGNLTLRLVNVPWQQALQAVLDAKGLASERRGNVVWVAPHAELAARRRLELESQQQLAELEPVGSAVFQLNYQRADDVRRMLLGQDGGPGGVMGAEGLARLPTSTTASGTRMLSRRGTLTADARTNQLFVADIAARLDAIRAFLDRIDIPVRQVVIEARIVEADDKFSRDLGVKLGLAGQFGAARAGSTYDSVFPGASGVPPLLSLPAVARTGAEAAHAAIGLFDRAATRLLVLELSALEAEGRGKIVSSPRVITANHIKALIEQGTELPYQAATSSGATSVQFRKANLKLEVTPQITPEGNVLLDVDVNKDSVGTQTTQGFAIDTKHVQTQVLVDNGGTVVIGGIYTQTERRDENKVPLLGDVPVLGGLFRNSATIRDRTELLVFLTPRILPAAAAAGGGGPDGGMQ